MGFSTKVHGPLKWVGALGTLDVTLSSVQDLWSLGY